MASDSTYYALKAFNDLTEKKTNLTYFGSIISLYL